MANELDRSLSLCFNLRPINGLNYDNVLAALQEVVEIDDIIAVQFTPNKCNVTLNDENAKNALLINGFNVLGKHVPLTEVDNQMTTATIKDAPYEMSDIYICTQMGKYGNVIQGSHKRGMVRNTDIQNGTRYVQLLNVDKPIPNSVRWGRFWVRIFCDNQKTECGYCGETTHPYFKCPTKIEKQQRCYKCLQPGHQAWECKGEVVCSLCLKPGHVKKQCNSSKNTKSSQEAPETEVDTTVLSEEELSASPVFGKSKTDGVVAVEKDKNEKTGAPCSKLVLGASLVKYIEIDNPEVEICAESGACMESIDKLIAQSKATHNRDAVDHVVVHLGTNDITHNADDIGQVIIDYTLGIHTLRESFPQAKISLCSVPPRKGQSDIVKTTNEASLALNRFIVRLISTDSAVDFIDTYPVLTNPASGIPRKTLYDKRDPSGVHLNGEGKRELKGVFLKTLGVAECIPDVKRKRGVTPSSTEKASKIKK